MSGRRIILQFWVYLSKETLVGGSGIDALFTSSCSISWGDGQKTAILFTVKTLYLNEIDLVALQSHNGHVIAADHDVSNNYRDALLRYEDMQKR
ncbi:UNVERIFIED_ORG: hypothetical protein QFZ59_003246 [Bacillus sp. B2I3]|nr:hypothetical protein [Bacillus sp. B2I3]